MVPTVHVYSYIILLAYFTQDIRRKVARVVAAKCILAARVDSFHENSEGDVHVGQGIHVHARLSFWLWTGTNQCLNCVTCIKLFLMAAECGRSEGSSTEED